MGTPDSSDQQLVLPQVNMNKGEIFVSQEEAARRYNQWVATRKPRSSWDKAFDSVCNLLPDWFLFSSLIAGIFVLGLVMLKINPLLRPIKLAFIWFLDFCEGFLKRDNPDESKK